MSIPKNNIHLRAFHEIFILVDREQFKTSMSSFPNVPCRILTLFQITRFYRNPTFVVISCGLEAPPKKDGALHFSSNRMGNRRRFSYLPFFLEALRLHPTAMFPSFFGNHLIFSLSNLFS